MASALRFTEPRHLNTSQPLHGLVDPLSSHPPLMHWIETDALLTACGDNSYIYIGCETAKKARCG